MAVFLYKKKEFETHNYCIYTLQRHENMKSNTKLIVETWRKFLLEESEDGDPMYDPDDGEPEGPATPPDEDLLDPLDIDFLDDDYDIDGDPINIDSPMDNEDDYDEQYNPNSAYRPGGPKDETLLDN